ncbi:MAG: helix-turn-helix domain-containing protein [Solirubrobacteraceae bacterium]|nr:helix-turn-helix domain-containing protein [Solirubrobacteraceae bacterium]
MPPDPLPTDPAARFDWRTMVADLTADPEWFDTTVAAIVTAIHRRVPELGEDPVVVSATEESVRDNLRLFGTMARRTLDVEAASLPAMAAEYARTLAHRGVPLEALIRTYHVALNVTWSLIADLLRDRSPDGDARADAIEATSTAMFAFVDALGERARAVYSEERARWSRSSSALRVETVRSILDGAPVDVSDAGRRLRYDLRRHHRAFVVWADDLPIEELKREATAIGRAVADGDVAAGPTVRPPTGRGPTTGRGGRASGSAVGPPLVVILGGGVVAGWVGGHAPPPRPTAGAPDVRVAYGEPSRGLEGFRRSHRQAMHARRVARARVRPSTDPADDGPVTGYDRVAVAALASVDADAAADLVASRLGPLAADSREARDLADTLHAYLLAQGRPRRTAQRLGVHENTIANRIRRIERLLGHPVDERVDELLVALALLPLSGTGTGPAPH